MISWFPHQHGWFNAVENRSARMAITQAPTASLSARRFRPPSASPKNQGVFVVEPPLICGGYQLQIIWSLCLGMFFPRGLMVGSGWDVRIEPWPRRNCLVWTVTCRRVAGSGRFSGGDGTCPNPWKSGSFLADHMSQSSIHDSHVVHHGSSWFIQKHDETCGHSLFRKSYPSDMGSRWLISMDGNHGVFCHQSHQIYGDFTILMFDDKLVKSPS